MDQLTVNVERRHMDRIEKRVENGYADNRSEAMRHELDDIRYTSTYEEYLTSLGNYAAMLGMFALGATFFFSIEIRVFALYPLIFSLVCYMVAWYMAPIMNGGIND